MVKTQLCCVFCELIYSSLVLIHKVGEAGGGGHCPYGCGFCREGMKIGICKRGGK